MIKQEKFRDKPEDKLREDMSINTGREKRRQQRAAKRRFAKHGWKRNRLSDI